MNIVLITIDCLRADHLSCFGYPRNTSPFLDTIAQKGIWYKNAFANGPNTRHSVPSFLTSTYPLLYPSEANGKTFHPGRKTLAEHLKKKGYTTAGIHSNPYVSKYYGYDRGFDYFNDFLLGQVEEDKKQNKISKSINELFKGVKAIFMKKLPHETGEEINNEAFKWIEKQTDKPFFLWLHYMDVHMPYVPPNNILEELHLPTYSHYKKIWMGKKIDDVSMRKNIKDEEIKDYINLYDGTIRYTDNIIKNLIKNIQKKYDDTVFFITADHGEEFREHGNLSHLNKLYDELIHVPLFIYGKNIPAKKIEKPVSLLSLAPTITQFTNINQSTWFQGKPFSESRDYIIAEALDQHQTTAYRDNKWKYIKNQDKNELYNIIKDPEEKINLYNQKQYLDKIKTFESIIDNHLQNAREERRKRNTWLQKQKIGKALKTLKKM